MPWIESHTVLTRHRKTLLTAHDLHLPPVYVVGHLTALWHNVLEQQEDGDLSGWPDSMIEEAAQWEGEPGLFATTLRKRHWVDDHLVHDWIDYVGLYLTKKYSSGNVPLLKQIWMKHGYKYGKGQGKYAKQQVSKKRVESERKERLPNLTEPNLTEPNLTKPKKNLSEEKPTEAQANGTVDSFTLTPELEAWSAKEGIPNPSQYIEEFKDYWRSAGGRRKNGQAVKDWAAAFRNRLRVLKDQGKLKSTSDWKSQFLAGEA